MKREEIFARLAHSYGTSAIHAIYAATAPIGSRMMSVASSTPHILQRLVTGNTKGTRLGTLSDNERHALSDIERVGLRIDRVRRPGYVVLVGTVIAVDQRTFVREVA